jgi:hypothetical protein
MKYRRARRMTPGGEASVKNVTIMRRLREAARRGGWVYSRGVWIKSRDSTNAASVNGISPGPHPIEAG